MRNEIKAEDNATSSSDERESGESDENVTAEAQADEDTLKPYGEKIGEGPGNLRQRERWFQQRTGSRK
ncbi:MAG TPA: hypothetical protein VGO91_05235 [Pyrinomonadaceae bacterium]|nr:hypothetical protein [Pyrinomonadaceae bacterium]